MKKSFFLLYIFSLLVYYNASAQLGIGVGLDHHVAGGGPAIGVTWQQKGVRIGLEALTQINAFTPYKFEPYGDYRFADNIGQVFGGGVLLGYIFKKSSQQKIKPIIMYRAGYFYTRFGKYQGYLSSNGEESSMFLYSIDNGFSTTQTISGGITAELGKNFVLDATLGSGVYIFRNRADFSSLRNPGFDSPFSPSTYVRPDLHLNIRVSYQFSLAKK